MDVRSLCTIVLDNWREFTGIQIGIASTMLAYERPAEMMTGKQKFRLDQALTIAEELGLVPFHLGK